MFYSGWTIEGASSEMLCPRHWYEPHFLCGTHVNLEDMTDEQYQEQFSAFEKKQGSGTMS